MCYLSGAPGKLAMTLSKAIVHSASLCSGEPIGGNPPQALMARAQMCVRARTHVLKPWHLVSQYIPACAEYILGTYSLLELGCHAGLPVSVAPLGLMSSYHIPDQNSFP